MSNPTPAQEEFADLLSKNSASNNEHQVHPEDRKQVAQEDEHDRNEQDEDDRYRAIQIDAAMRTPAAMYGADLKLPPASFDDGRATGVKGVIADARSYENARRTKWKDRARAVRRSVFGLNGAPSNNSTKSQSDTESVASDPEEETFLQQWREKRRQELEAESLRNGVVRTRRTSPSMRMFGHLDEVDALGYLDAIERVGMDTTVVVFVYDHESQVSTTVESALLPLVGTYPIIHFVKVHYEDIEFDNAAVPALLVYRNQGDLFANLTSVIDLIPDTEDFDTDALKRLFEKHNVI